MRSFKRVLKGEEGQIPMPLPGEGFTAKQLVSQTQDNGSASLTGSGRHAKSDEFKTLMNARLGLDNASAYLHRYLQCFSSDGYVDWKPKVLARFIGGRWIVTIYFLRQASAVAK